MRKMIWILFGISLLLLLAGVGVGGIVWKQMQQPLMMPADGMVYQVKPGGTLRSVGQDLFSKKIIADPRFLELWGRWVEPGSAIKVGEYQLPENVTLSSLLSTLRDGQAIQHKLTIVEGMRFNEVVVELKKLAADGLIEQTIDDGQHAAVFKELAGIEHVEGWVFPDTYHFQRNDSDRDLLQRAQARMQQVLSKQWEARADDLPLKSPYEALVLASIIEKETGVASERPAIGGVFVERLNRGMRLQTDPTVIYGMGDAYKGNIRKKDLRKDTAYNTYTRDGLPPTPIAMPGEGAIYAATHPEITGNLFFVAKGGGAHHFTKTYAEHRKAVVKYLLGGNAARYQGDK